MTLAVQDRLIGSQEPRLASTAHGDTTHGAASADFLQGAKKFRHAGQTTTFCLFNIAV